MIKLNENLKIEKNRLNRMIENNDGDIFNDLILRQSIKVDELVIFYIKSNYQLHNEKMVI